MLVDKVKLLLEREGKKMKDLCSYVGITDAGMRKIFKRDSCEMNDLKKISLFFNVNVSFFFDEESRIPKIDNNSIAISGNENHINSETTKFLEIIENQNKQINKYQDQIDKLLDIIKNINQ
jgi:hypothetical protein